MPELGRLTGLGYSQREASVRLGRLMADPDTWLVDIRFSPYSRLRPEWSLKSLAEVYGERYRWLGDTLGNVNYREHDAPITLAHPEQGCDFLEEWLRAGHTLVLLCTCAVEQECHRHVVKELMAARLPELTILEEE